MTRISIAPVKALGLVFPDEVELGPLGVDQSHLYGLLERIQDLGIDCRDVRVPYGLLFCAISSLKRSCARRQENPASAAELSDMPPTRIELVHAV